MLRRGASAATSSVLGCAMRRVGINGVARGLRVGSGVGASGTCRTGAAATTGTVGGSGRMVTTAGGGAAAATDAGVTMRGGGGAGVAARTSAGAGVGCADKAGCADGTGGAATAGRAATTAGGVTTATAARGGTATAGRLSCPVCCACRRSRMARAMSPGLDAREKSTFCRASACCDALRDEPRPPVMCPRTFAASSSSMDELCVFFSVTPTAVSASRMLLLLTSSSRARSLIRTLLNPPSSPHRAPSCT